MQEAAQQTYEKELTCRPRQPLVLFVSPFDELFPFVAWALRLLRQKALRWIAYGIVPPRCDHWMVMPVRQLSYQLLQYC